jgi:prepilin-type N-terminal cleavage/methylation domain-containing protein
MSRKRCGFTLMEILIVIAIIILLVGILIPVVLRSKRSAKTVVCTSNLRQASMAWTMYADNHDGKKPWLMADLVSSIGDTAILRCPLDTFEPGANSASSNQVGEKISYFIPDAHELFRAALETSDPNYGVLACVLHGEPTGPYSVQMPLQDTTGLVLRARLDTSVQRVQVGHICVDDQSGGRMSTRSTWTLFTDAWPGPEPWCPANCYRCN